MKEINFNNIKLYLCKDYAEVSEVAAGIVAAQVNSKQDSVLGLATGGTPEGMYKEIIKKNQNNEVDFSQVTTFNLDEYYPLDKANEQSYDYYMKNHLFNHININMEKINIPNGMAKDPNDECDSYDNKIIEAGGVDLQVLGIGNNGHIGFNEPADHYAAKTNYVNLQESTITANSRYFDSADQVPKHALTMGIKPIMMAKKILLLVSGAGKAQILKETITGSVTPSVPASVLQLHHDVIVVADEEAASVLLQ